MSLSNLYRGPVGRKIVMAATGLMLIGFIIAHLLGNITIYLGANGINAYAMHLHQFGPLLWVFRLGLLAIFATHVLFGVLLTLENRRARPVAYRKKRYQRTTLAGRTMIYTGLVLAAFIAGHLLHFTFRAVGPEHALLLDAQQRPDVYRMVVLSFRQVGYALAYAVAMGALFLHLGHGFGSLLQTFGLNNERSLPVTGRVSQGFGLLLLLGFVSIPALIFFGILKLA
jgi:succinate dehydrogenase / fumarate reductase cytochrome b subunit